MSGPCLISWKAVWRRADGLESPGHRRSGTMKCWSREEGERAIRKHKVLGAGWTIEILDFRSAPTRAFTFDVFRRDTGATSRVTFNRRSRRDAKKWEAFCNRQFGRTHHYRLVSDYTVAQEKRMERQLTPVFPHLAPPRQPIPSTSPQDVDAAIRVNPAAAIDPEAKRIDIYPWNKPDARGPVPLVDTAGRAKPLPEIEIGDTIVARHTVTHAGDLPNALCGVKIGNVVVGFKSEDIIDVIKTPVLAGQRRKVDGSMPVVVEHVMADYSTVRPLGDGVPFVVETSRLKAAA